jgi:ribose-phosphate pyrophosphokinase
MTRTLTLFGGNAHPALTTAVASALGVDAASRTLQRFPDSEIEAELGVSVRGQSVYLLQPTGPPVADHLIELLLLADATRRGGAARVTAVIPYFGYARQDRRAHEREALGARVVADMVEAAHIDSVVAIDLHTSAIEGFFSAPLLHLSAVPALAEALRASVAWPAVVVAPDLGAVKLAEQYAQRLQLPTAVVRKVRLSGTEVRATEIIGDVRGHVPIVVDDMISTAGTVRAAVHALLAAGCQQRVFVAATHGVFVGPAEERLRDLPLARLLVTDTLPAPSTSSLPVQVVSVAPLLADAIRILQRPMPDPERFAHH